MSLGTPALAATVGHDAPNPQVLQLLYACCAGPARARQDDLVLSLHQQILELFPAQTGNLARNGRPLCRRLAGALLFAAAPGQARGSAEALLIQVGIDNAEDGFPSDQYTAVIQAMLRAVRVTFRGEWTSVVSSGWVEYLLWVRAHLMAGAAVVQQHGGASRPAIPLADGSSAADGVFGHPAAAGHDEREEDPDDDFAPAYGELMVAMTRTARRDRRARPE